MRSRLEPVTSSSFANPVEETCVATKSTETSAICPAAETLPTSSKMTMACSGDDSNGDRQEDESFWNQRDGHDG